MDKREEIKNQYIETCLKIEMMECEYASATADWRAMLRQARKKRDALLSQIANGDVDRLYTPPLPGMASGDDTLHSEE